MAAIQIMSRTCGLPCTSATEVTLRVGQHARIAQLVERLPSKQNAAGSSPVSRSKGCVLDSECRKLGQQSASRVTSGEVNVRDSFSPNPTKSSPYALSTVLASRMKEYEQH